MKKTALFLALLLVATLGGCNRDEDLNDTLTSGTWRMDYFQEQGDDHTFLFSGYIFTFLADGKVTVTRPGTPPPVAYWNEFNNGTRLEFNFGAGVPLEKLNETWVVDHFDDHEINLHELSEPATYLRFDKL